MAQALLSKLASAAEFVAVPGAILVAYFTTSRSTEPKRGRNGKPSAFGKTWSSSSSSSESSESDPVKYDDGKDLGPPWIPKDRW